MKIACYILGFCSVLAAASIGRAQSNSSAGDQGLQKSPPVAAQLEDFERRIGPLKIKERSFLVVLHLKRVRVPGTRAVGSEETVAQMDIRDEAGKTQYEKSFPYEVEGDHFAETTDVSAQALEGNQGSGLLVTYGIEPSTPLGGQSWQVFGTFSGKLVPFSKPISIEGNLINARPDEPIVKTSMEPGLQADVLHFRIWTGNFFVVIPVRVDWMLAKASLAWRCMKMTSRGQQPVCRFNPEVEQRIPPGSELTFVRLLPEYFEPEGTAEHAVVKKDSKVEFLDAAGVVVWNEDGEIIQLGVSEDLWLKVRIDGKEGWIHTQEDFNAIGLPQAG